ncbi:MAG: EAL domain-containing protein [Chloroflexi bacterium]|nr:EAL domain-containing protein [Chloroflexota bacterium]
MDGGAWPRVLVVSFAVTMVAAVGCLGTAALTPGVAPAWRLALALCLPWLILYWVRGLVREQISPWGAGAAPLAALLVGQAFAGADGTPALLVLLLLAASLWFESLASAAADTIVRTAVYATAYLIVLAQTVDPGAPVTWSRVIGPLLVLTMVAGVAWLVVRYRMADAQARITHRRLIRSVGAIASADRHDHIAEATCSATRLLLRDDEWVRVALGTEHALQILASAGGGDGPPPPAASEPVQLSAAALATLMSGGMLVETGASQQLHRAFAIDSTAHVTVVPLLSGTVLHGLIVAGSRDYLSGAQQECLAMVTSLATLALQHRLLTLPAPPVTPPSMPDDAGDAASLMTGQRLLFLQAVRRSLLAAGVTGGEVVVMHLDIDRFRIVNDSLGHMAGDQVLSVIADRLGAMLGPGATLARIGGDEFAMLAPDLTDVWSAIRCAGRLLEAVQEPIAVEDQMIVVSASIGIALGQHDQDEAEAVFQHAAIAMTEAKRQGRGRYVIYDPSMASIFAERLALETGLRRALKDGELMLHYQPLLDLATGRVTEVEALVRWQHPERGLLLPGDFIALAEETGLIVPLGQWVLTEACREVQAWQRRHPDQPALTVGVNLSAPQFQQPGLVALVARALGTAKLDSRQLKLEITETVALLDAESTLFTLNELRLLGVTLAMDDFGTGYSALRSLKRFPIDHLKIDRSFIGGLGLNAGDTAIVRAVVEFAKSLDLRITAEGVETIQQLRELINLGCDLGQGYLIAEPRPWTEVIALLTCQAVIEDDDRLVWRAGVGRAGRLAS